MKNIFTPLFPEKSISRNAWIYALGTYSSKIISIIIFPIIAVELGYADTGRYDLVISTVAILGPVFSMQIADAIYRWLTDADDQNKVIGFTNGTAVLLTMTVLLAVITFFAKLSGPAPLLLVGAAILMSQMLLNTMMQVLRGNSQVKLYAGAMIVRSVVFTLGELWAVFYSENKLENVLAAFAVANLASLVVCVSWGIKRDQFSFHFLRWRHIKALLSYALPLVFNTLGWLLLINANKYIIKSQLGFEMNGIFAVAEKLATPVFFLGIFYFFSAQDHFHVKKDFKSLKGEFRQLLKKVSLITSGGVVLLLVGVYLLLPLIFPDLAASIEYLPLMVLANLFMILGVYLSIPYTYHKKSMALATTTLKGFVVTLVLSIALVNAMGLYGVYIGILAGTFLTMVLRVRFARSFFKS
ncbi:MAG: oligosaccharide flippase family protein [Roseivirga sp.]|nr:oligosaccharide flippase family protein [Roseivirga sp.]